MLTTKEKDIYIVSLNCFLKKKSEAPFKFTPTQLNNFNKSFEEAYEQVIFFYFFIFIFLS